jgi:aspartate racemase
LHSAKLVLYSVDFHEIEILQHSGAWDEAGLMLAQAARSLQAAGADLLILCTNTMHKVANSIESAVSIPFFHIADPTAQEIKQAGLKKVGLLGTRFTMEQEFYRGRLRDQHHLDVLIPDDADRGVVHKIIYQELCLGLVRDVSRAEYRRIIHRLVDQGAQGVILGCTEISLLVGPPDAPVPMFDTTAIHARKASEWALGEEGKLLGQL